MSVIKKHAVRFVPPTRAVNEIKRSRGTIFGVAFLKTSGQIRKMVCRTKVRKGVKGTSNRDTEAEDARFGYARVFDINAMGFRRINLNTVIRLRVRGVETVV